MKNILRINKSNRNIYTAIIAVILLSVLFFMSIFHSINDIPKNEPVEKSPKSKESDIIITPVGEKAKIFSLENFIYLNSYLNIQYIEYLFRNWLGLFDLFSSNPNFRQKVKAINVKDLEKLSAKVLNLQSEFKLGSVDNLVTEFGDLIKRECNYYKLDWRLVLAIVRQESFFNANAKSRAGAFGLMQIMPRTGAGLQSQLNLEDTRTPQNNLIAGIYYYATLIESFQFAGEERYKFALAAYNAGLGRVIDAMSITLYFGKDYKEWNNVKESYPYLASSQDSIQALIWPETKRPPGGTLNNWKEPYNYVASIIFYYNEYKKYYESNLKEENQKKTKKKKSKK